MAIVKKFNLSIKLQIIISLLLIFFLIVSCSKENSQEKSKLKAKQANLSKKKQKSDTDIGSLARYIVVCKNTSLYLQPSMKSKKAVTKVQKGNQLYISSIIKLKDKKSFDFAKTSVLGKTYYIPLQLIGSVSSPQKYKNGNIIIGQEIVDKYRALPLKYQPNDLKNLSNHYKTPGYKSRVMQLRKEAIRAFTEMVDDAKSDGINIRFISCFRSSDYQEIPYKRTMRQLGPKQKSSAKPGHSEHQLGTAADISSDEVQYQLTQKFAKTKAYEWVKRNASKYGIRISYTKENYMEKGYIWEPWHLRYWGKGLK